MNALALWLTNIDLSILLEAIGRLAKIVAGTIAPVLLILSIFIRLMETQLDALIGNGKLAKALRDIVGWTFVLGSYFAIMSLVVGFFNEIYKWLDGFGSVNSIMSVYQVSLDQSVADIGIKDVLISGVPGAIFATIAGAAYFISLMLVAAVSVFLKIATILVFGIAFIWGLIAIPVSISMTFRILRGWAQTLFFSMVWPVIQGLLLALFSLLMKEAIDRVVNVKPAVFQAADLMVLYTVMNILLIAILITAPIVANVFVSNASAGLAIAMPFVGAAAASVAAVGGGASEGAKGGAKKLAEMATKPEAGQGPQARPSPRRADPGAGAGPTPRVPRAAPATTPAGGAAAGSGGSPGSPPAPSPGSGDRANQQRQQRRGVMINRLRKNGGNTP